MTSRPVTLPFSRIPNKTGVVARSTSAGIAVILLVALVWLRPMMPDGDGLSYAAVAMDPEFREINAKHLIYPALLRTIYSALVRLRHEELTIPAMSFLSAIAGIGIYLTLAHFIYPIFIQKRTVAYGAAAGALLSFGLFSRAITIETYALALLTDVVLVAICLRGDLRRTSTIISAGVVSVLAIGMHITNVLITPLIIMLLMQRAARHGSITEVLGKFVLTGLLAAGSVMGLLLLAQGTPLSMLDLTQVLPRGDVQPPMGLADHLARASYGFARSIAWLPPSTELSLRLAVIYSASAFGCAAIVAYLASNAAKPRTRTHQFPKNRMMLLAIIAPYAAVGVYYFPSDPERWLFLLPVVWLLIGLVWDRYRPSSRSLLTSARSVALLFLLVATLGCYNILSKILPEAKYDRDLSGLQQLDAVASDQDLVISPSGITAKVYELFLGNRPHFDNLTLPRLVAVYGNRTTELQDDLRRQIIARLKSGGKVYAYRLIGEGFVKGRGYPWAHFPDYGPETFLTVLKEFDPIPVVPPTPEHAGTFRLRTKKV